MLHKCLFESDVKISKVFLFLFCTLLTGFSFNLFANDIYIFTLNHQFAPLTESKAKMIYRGKSTTLSGNKISLLDLAENSPTRHNFYSNLLKKNSTQMVAQWASLAFSGKANTPDELSDDSFAQVLLWLEENPNGLAYFSLTEPPTNVRVLYKLEIK